jgi:hypothetical protein
LEGERKHGVALESDFAHLEGERKHGVALESDFAHLERGIHDETLKIRSISGLFRTGEADRGNIPSPIGQIRIAEVDSYPGHSIEQRMKSTPKAHSIKY